MSTEPTVKKTQWTWHGVVYEFNHGVTQRAARAYSRERAYWLRHHARRRILRLLKGRMNGD
jgi:hypothetical protein